MSAVGALAEALQVVFSGSTPVFIIVGVLLGSIMGALPGIGASLGMAILLPITVQFNSINAIILLVSVYSGAIYGGSISAILLNVPGTSGSAATTFDGYALSKMGKAKDALTMSAASSAIAGFFTIASLIIISPVIVAIVLLFGSPETFLIAIVGLSLITIVTQGSMVKGVIAGGFGLMLTTIGTAQDPTPRYTFGYPALFDGIDFIAALIGLFAITEMMILAKRKGGIAGEDITVSGSIKSGLSEVRKYPRTLLKSGYIGMLVGAIPGSGSATANFVSYAEAVRSSDNPDEFGKGSTKGMIAAEASNNGTIGGSLIPALSFGIPGSGATAVLLGGLLMHGLNPGPDLFSEELATTYSFFIALLISNILILLFGITAFTKGSYITKIDTIYIIPTITVLAALGTLSIRNNWVDVFTILILGIIGYYMRQHNYSIIAFVLGVVLGPIIEENFLRSLRLGEGSYWIFVETPLSILLLSLLFLLLASPILSPIIHRIKSYIKEIRS